MYEEITASSLIKVDLKRQHHRQLESGLLDQSAGLRDPQRDSRRATRRGCVLHTHTNAGMAVSVSNAGCCRSRRPRCAGRGLRTMTSRAWWSISTSRKRLAENLGDSEVMILRNHGLLAVGQTIGQAFNNIYRLERACQTQLLAMACNAEIIAPAARRYRALERAARGVAVAGRPGQEASARLDGMAGAETDARPARRRPIRTDDGDAEHASSVACGRHHSRTRISQQGAAQQARSRNGSHGR